MFGATMLFCQQGPLLLLPFLFSATVAYFSCDFEDGSMCGYKVVRQTDTFKWQVYNADLGSDNIDIYSDPKSLKGSFLYLSPQAGSNDIDVTEPASLVSGYSRIPSGTYCLQFKYRMFGPHVGELRIGLQKKHSDVTWLFQKSGNQGDRWHWPEIEMTEPQPGLLSTSLIIEGHRRVNLQGEIAVDDIQLYNRKCLRQRGIPCSFTTDCGYSNFGQKKDKSLWHIRSGFDGVEKPGPKADYETGTQFGSWAIAELDKDTSFLETVSLDIKGLKIPKNKNKCVRFRYYLGVNASLQAGTAVSNSRDWLWLSRDSDPRDKWLHGEVSVYNMRKDIMLAFKALKGKKTDSTYVALDDVVVSSGKCPIRGNNYFEDGFDLYDNTDEDDDFDWIVTSTSAFKESNVNLRDHTTETIMGHFALAYFEGENEGNTAQLLSPTFRRGEVSCLQFSYFFSSEDAGFLNIYLKNEKSSQDLITINATKITDIDDRAWISKTISVAAKVKTFQLVFEATVGNKNTEFIALDDIIVSGTSCSVEDSVVDWSPVLSLHVTSTIDCTFENKTLCNWEQAADSDFDLQILEIGEDTMGPKTYHFGQDQENVLLKPSKPANTGRGGVTSPVLSGTTQGHCLSFWYWLHGRGVSLEVHTTSLDQDEEDTLVWQRLYDNGEGWQWAEMVIYAETDFQVAFGFHHKHKCYRPFVCKSVCLGISDP